VHGYCQCAGGWSGTGCKTPFCKPDANRTDCSGRGDCVVEVHSISCKCDDGYEGERCEASKCSLNCKHGGYPNAKCTACEGCLGAWTGTTCEVWDDKVPLGELQAKFNTLVNASQRAYEATLPYNPLCRQFQECVGWGANVRDGSMASFAVLDMSYSLSNQTLPWLGNRRVPKGVRVTQRQNPQFEYDTRPWPTMPDFADYVLGDLAGSQKGARGLYSGDIACPGFTPMGDGTLADVFSAYYQGGMCAPMVEGKRADVGLTVTHAQYTLYQTDCIEDECPGYVLTTHALNAINSLPPTYNASDATKQLYRDFFEKYGTSVVTRTGSGGWMELISRWSSALHPHYRPDWLKTQGQIEFRDLTGLPVQQGEADAVYKRYWQGHDLRCVGGADAARADCHKAAGRKQWLQSLRQSPVLLDGYESRPISHFVADSTVAKSLNDAVGAYMKEMRAAWAAVDKRPPTCNGYAPTPTDKAEFACACEGPCRQGRMCSEPGVPGLKRKVVVQMVQAGGPGESLGEIDCIDGQYTLDNGGANYQCITNGDGEMQFKYKGNCEGITAQGPWTTDQMGCSSVQGISGGHRCRGDQLIRGCCLASEPAWVWGFKGDSHICNGMALAITALGTAGKDADCGDDTWYKFKCGKYPRSQSLHAATSPQASGSWVCGRNGEDVQCPPGKIATGFCSGGDDPDCAKTMQGKCWNFVDAYTAVYCSEPAERDAGRPVVHNGTWRFGGGPGTRGKDNCNPAQCAAGELACGACSSAGGSDCGNRRYYSGLKCCPIS